MSEVIFASSDSIEVGQIQIDSIKAAALRSILGRARLCLHSSHSDLIQEMVIAICKSSIIAPHRQLGKSKSYLIIEGGLKVLFFDHQGMEIRSIEMGPMGGEKTFVYRFPADEWHTVLPISEMVVYVETISGPYRSEETEFADWSNVENVEQ